MEKQEKNLLTTNEFICTIIAILIGISVLYLPSSTVEKAKQDGWIAVLLGAVYPLYVILISSVIIKRHPDISIMNIYKKYLGRVVGNIFNLLYMFQFLYYVVGLFTAAINLFFVYSTWFMTQFKMTIIFAAIILYGVSKGLKVLARINVITFFIMCVLLFSAVTSFSSAKGSILNLQPVFGSGLNNILSGVKTTMFSYATMSIIFIINPYVEKKDKIIKAEVIGTVISAFFYTWCVALSVVGLGVKTTIKNLWPFAFATEIVRLTVINNLRFIWMILWPIVAFRTTATFYYMSAEITNNIFDIGFKKCCIILLPILIIFPMFFENEVVRRKFYGSVTLYVVIFDIVYITLIAVLVLIKNSSLKKSNL